MKYGTEKEKEKKKKDIQHREHRYSRHSLEGQGKTLEFLIEPGLWSFKSKRSS